MQRLLTTPIAIYGAALVVKRVGLLPAAGAARRLGIDAPKELLRIDGQPVIDHSVAHLLGAGVEEIAVVIRPSKAAIADHLTQRWPDVQFRFPEQEGAIGNLLDGIRAAAPVCAGAETLLLFPDTLIRPQPFVDDDFVTDPEVALYCHDAGADWANYGVVDAAAGLVVEKPDIYRGSICWGAARWQPVFWDRLARVSALTDAINQAEWRHTVTIDDYLDIGLAPRRVENTPE